MLEVPARLRADRSGRVAERAGIPIEAELTLRPGVPRLEIELRVENSAEDHRLKVVFPLGQPIEEGVYDGAYQIVRRPTRLPAGGEDWIEQPAAECPMRCFVGAESPGGGMLIANRGLREASVSPQGEIAITLIRSFGWLSRDDLATRRGDAGPKLETPGGQEPGSHTFSLSLVPIRGSLNAAVAEAYAFQSEMRLVGAGLHSGRLPSASSLLAVSGEGLALTGVKLSEEGEDLIVRCVNLTPARLEATLETFLPIREAIKARLDETPSETLAVEGGRRVRFPAGPHEIVTLRLSL
jgi:alpha-mannosidase